MSKQGNLNENRVTAGVLGKTRQFTHCGKFEDHFWLLGSGLRYTLYKGEKNQNLMRSSHQVELMDRRYTEAGGWPDSPHFGLMKSFREIKKSYKRLPPRSISISLRCA